MKKLLALSSAFATFLFTLSAFAQDGAAASNSFDAQIASALGAALDGIARNPGADAKIRTPMILGLALIESLVLYALLIAFFLQGKVGAH